MSSVLIPITSSFLLSVSISTAASIAFAGMPLFSFLSFLLIRRKLAFEFLERISHIVVFEGSGEVDLCQDRASPVSKPSRPCVATCKPQIRVNCTSALFPS